MQEKRELGMINSSAPQKGERADGPFILHLQKWTMGTKTPQNFCFFCTDDSFKTACEVLSS